MLVAGPIGHIGREAGVLVEITVESADGVWDPRLVTGVLYGVTEYQ
jgi:hypothetical protein